MAFSRAGSNPDDALFIMKVRNLLLICGNPDFFRRTGVPVAASSPVNFTPTPKNTSV